MFRSNMTPPEIAAMIESLYRVRGGAVDFRTLSLQPRPFLGTNGFQLDYEHLDDDELWRRGRAVGTVINGELYLILLDAAKSHYFDATLPDFEAVVASAQFEALADRRNRRRRRLSARRGGRGHVDVRVSARFFRRRGRGLAGLRRLGRARWRRWLVGDRAEAVASIELLCALNAWAKATVAARGGLPNGPRLL